jgi:CTP-dependent riboflavin kinase
MISRAEFNMKNQWIKLKRCQLLGIDAVIIRPERHDDPKRTELYYRLELMAQCHIRNTFGLGDGDEVTVTVP